MKNLFIIITATFCLLLQPLAGVDVPVTGSDLIGTRTNPESSGVFSTEGWSGSSPNGFTIHWNISNLNNGSYRYTYGLTNANPAASLSINPVTGTPSLSNNPLSKGLSHVIFQVSSNFTGDNINSVTGATLNPSDIKTYNPSDPGNSNPGLPGSFFGIKFEDPTSETLPLIQFDSDRIPIWGHFYAVDGKKPGSEVYAYNTGFGEETLPGEDTTNFTNWIPVPDTKSVEIPEPGTMIILGSSLAAIAYRKRKKVKG